MNRWIISTILFLFYTEEVVSQSNRILSITDGEVAVWIDDNVTIVAVGTVVSQWSFDNTIIATLPLSQDTYNYPNISPLGNIIASAGEEGSQLFLNNVSRVFTGTYQADGDPDVSERYLLNMTVHGRRFY